MMRSKSFETQEVREIGWKEQESREAFPSNCNGRCLPDGRKGMQRSRKIKNVKKKIHARARKAL